MQATAKSKGHLGTTPGKKRREQDWWKEKSKFNVVGAEASDPQTRPQRAQELR